MATGTTRRAARERALELLYEQAIKGCDLQTLLAGLEATPDPYTVELLTAVAADREWAEALLAQHATDWPLERMSVVDRLIMTMALCETRLKDAPPRGVVLSEAVELATIFSSDAAPRFINGVLAAAVPTEGSA